MSDASGQKMKDILLKSGFNPTGERKTKKGDIYVGEREAWIKGPVVAKGMEVVYFIVSDQVTHGPPATYSSAEGVIPSREERVQEAFRHAEASLNG